MSLRMTFAAAVLLGATAMTAAPARATPAEDLAKARQAFQLGNYEGALPLLTYLLYPDAKLSREADLIEAHVLLGVAHFELGNEKDARRELEEALFLDSDLELDPLLFSEKAIAFFARRKADALERAKRDAQARALAEERERLRRALENMVVLERKPYFINFVPFGAGQFQNGHTRKGIFFFASEAALGGTSMTLWIVQVAKYGFNGVVPDGEADAVRRMQQFQVGTGVACLLLVGTGIVDALINYQSVTRRPADESLLQNLSKPSGPAIRLLPGMGPEGPSMTLSWEF